MAKSKSSAPKDSKVWSVFGLVSTLAAGIAAKKFLNELIEKVYDGSAMSLVLQALATGKASREEIAEARRLLDEMGGKS